MWHRLKVSGDRPGWTWGLWQTWLKIPWPETLTCLSRLWDFNKVRAHPVIENRCWSWGLNPFVLLLAISLDLNDIGLQVLESLEASLVLVLCYSCCWILCVQGEGPAKVLVRCLQIQPTAYSQPSWPRHRCCHDGRWWCCQSQSLSDHSGWSWQFLQEIATKGCEG